MDYALNSEFFCLRN